MSVTTLPQIASIQGEQQPPEKYAPASQDDVDEYVEGASDAVLACREGIHSFPGVRKSEMAFTEVDEDDLFVWRVECGSCGCATRVDKYEWVGGPKRGRMVFVSRDLQYHPNRKTGERYLAPPGTGRYTKRAVRSAIVTMAMRGQSPAALKKALKRAQEQ